MKLTILGCGTSSIRKDFFESSYLLEDEDSYYLFDSGVGSLIRLLDVNVKLDQIKNVFYTHLHNDHINDLPGLIWARNWGGYDPVELNIHGPEGIKQYFDDLMKYIIRKEPSKFIYPISVKEVTNKEFDIDKLKIKTQKLNHHEDIAYRIEKDGKAIVYSGDTDYCNEIAEIAKDADILILECGVADGNPDGHMSPSKCGKAAKEANVKKLVLVHLYPELDDVDAISIVKQQFDGEVILGKDLMEFEL